MLALAESVLLYLLITVVTCMWAAKVKRDGTIAYMPDGRRSAGSLLNRIYLVGIFTVLFLCSALRFNVGNDYEQYTKTAHEAFVGGYVVTEAGFNYLVRIVYTIFGGEYYEIVFAIFALATLIIFLKALYEQSGDFALAFFLFMTLGLYFQTFNTVRYYLALGMALYSMRYVLRKDLLKFLLWIAVAALFHKSVLLVIPVYLLANCRWKKWYVIAGGLFSVLCFVGHDYVLALALKLYPSYVNTSFLQGEKNPLGLVRTVAILLFYLWCIKKEPKIKENREISLYAKLNLIALSAYVFFSFLPNASRLAYYFSVTQLLMIPKLLRELSDEKIRKWARILIILAYVCNFALFLYKAGGDGVKLIPYHSWLFENRFTYK